MKARLPKAVPGSVRRFRRGLAALACVVLPILSPIPVGAACPPCDGYFDPTFAGTGRRTLPLQLDPNDPDALYRARPEVLQRDDGELFVAGTCKHTVTGTYGDVCVALLRPDGAMDYAFGPDQLGTVRLSELGIDSTVLEAAAQTGNGQIAMALSVDLFHHRVIVLAADGGHIARQSLDFTLDPLAQGQTQGVSSMAVQPDGKVLLAGDAVGWIHSQPQPSHMAVVRLLPDLSDYDQGFGVNGHASVDFDTNGDGVNEETVLHTMALQRDGRILLGGALYQGGLSALARLDADGHLDLSFGIQGSGRITTDFGEGVEAINAMVLDRHDRILVGGHTDRYRSTGYGSEMAINRLLPDGAQDPSFGSFDPLDPAGPVILGANRGSEKDDYLSALALQPDGRIVAVGYGSAANPGSSLDFEVLRLDGRDGQPDWDFGAAAASMGDLGCAAPTADDLATGVVVQRGIVVAGLCTSTSPSLEARYGIARLKVDRIFVARFEP